MAISFYNFIRKIIKVKQNTKNIYFKYEIAFIFFISMLIPSFSAFTSGISWDEPFYIISGCKYATWLFNLNLNSFNYETILNFWKINHEHPPLVKIGFGVFNLLFSDYIGYIFSARLFNIVLSACFNVFLFIFIRKKYCTFTAWITIFILLTLEKYISYSTIATLDFPLTVFWTLTVITYFLSFDKKKYFLLSLIFFSMAFLTKFNAIFLIIPLFTWGLIYQRKIFLTKLLIMIIIALFSLLIFWPWLWHNTQFRFFEYIQNKTGRIGILHNINTENKTDTFANKPPSKVPVHYLGKNYKEKNAPFHYAFIIFNATVPLSLLILFYLSIFLIMKNFKTESFGVLCIMNTFISILIFSLPMLPKYGGVRFFHQAYPFLAMTIAIGIKYFYTNQKNLKNKLLTLFLIVFSYLTIQTVKNVNHLNAYYNLIFPANITMPLDHADTLLKIKGIKFLNENMSKNSKLKIIGTGSYVLDLYYALNYFRKDIIIEKEYKKADYLIIIPSREFFTDEILKIYEGNSITWKLIYSNNFCKFFIKNIQSKK